MKRIYKKPSIKAKRLDMEEALLDNSIPVNDSDEEKNSDDVMAKDETSWPSAYNAWGDDEEE